MHEQQAILEHLLAHKAMSNEKGVGKLDCYIELVNNLRMQTARAWVAIKSPIDREIILIFELAIDEKLDPWDVDLTKFASLYMKKVKKEQELDLITAGYLILLAWNILRLQADSLLENIAAKQAQEELFPWDVIPEWAFGDENYNYTNAILSGSVALEERIRRKGARRVTLIELVTAFEKAKKYVEERKLRVQAKEQYIKEALKDALVTLDEKLVKEELESDAASLWTRICKLNTLEPVALRLLCNGSKEEYINGIISVLYLTTKGRLRVWQSKFPYGEIYVKRLT
jgi:segregation and condensation protein A